MMTMNERDVLKLLLYNIEQQIYSIVRSQFYNQVYINIQSGQHIANSRYPYTCIQKFVTNFTSQKTGNIVNKPTQTPKGNFPRNFHRKMKWFPMKFTLKLPRKNAYLDFRTRCIVECINSNNQCYQELTMKELEAPCGI